MIPRKREKERRREGWLSRYARMNSAKSRSQNADLEVMSSGLQKSSSGLAVRSVSEKLQANDSAKPVGRINWQKLNARSNRRTVNPWRQIGRKQEQSETPNDKRQAIKLGSQRMRSLRKVWVRAIPHFRTDLAGKSFLDRRSRVTKDGRTILRGLDMEKFRREMMDRSNGYCQALSHASACTDWVAWESGHLHHIDGKGLGGSKHDDVPHKVQWLSESCHREATRKLQG
jgi:hypothetical protein